MQNWQQILDRPFHCRSPQETHHLAANLAPSLTPKSTLALEGPLGAGKTEFVKGIVSALGCPTVPTSPTFAIAHEYTGGKLPVFHFDFYRLKSFEEILTSGWFECLGTGIVLAEWASRFPACLPDQTLWVTLEITSPTTRLITFSNHQPL